MTARSQRGSSAAALLVAIAALIVGVVALGVALQRRGPAGPGLAAYDLTTPQSAVRSLMQMQANGDVQAQMELEQAACACHKTEIEASIASLKMGATYEVDAKTVVLYTAKRDGRERYEVQWLEKGPDGRYHPVLDLPAWLWEEGTGKKAEVAKAIREWEAKNAPGEASATE